MSATYSQYKNRIHQVQRGDLSVGALPLPQGVVEITALDDLVHVTHFGRSVAMWNPKKNKLPGKKMLVWRRRRIGRYSASEPIINLIMDIIPIRNRGSRRSSEEKFRTTRLLINRSHFATTNSIWVA